MLRRLFFLAYLILFLYFYVYAQPKTEINTVGGCERFVQFRKEFPDELFKDYYPFINYAHNFFEFPEKNIGNDFFTLCNQTSERKIRILHIGDSHIHSDIFTGYVRMRLQKIFGSGGRGLIFPFCAAGIHATRDYKTNCTGNWTSAKSTEKSLLYDVGVTGVTARTTDVNATASIIFRQGFALKNEPVLLSLLYLPGSNAFNVMVSSGKYQWNIIEKNEELGVMRGTIEQISDTLTISFYATDSLQNYFELYGIIVEYQNSTGIIYNSAGINGAALQNLVGQKLIEKHLLVINPDLLILDLGTNDIYRGAFDETVLYKLLTSVIQRIRTTLPEVQIMLLPPQDMYYRKSHVVSTEKFSHLLRKVAMENNCFFYDYFLVSGGNYSMLQWEKNALAKKDRIHLTTEGYELKGKLFVVAFLDAYLSKNFDKYFSSYPKNPLYDSACVSLWFLNEKSYNGTNLSETKTINLTPKAPTTEQSNKDMTVHIVKSGESLGVIAKKYRVTVTQIQQWNNLKSTVIYPGQKLQIHGNIAQNTTNEIVKQNNDLPKAQQSTESMKKVVYIVKSGDTLYAIAKSNNVTVENIKKWNNLNSDKIHPGQQLILYK